MLAVPIAITGSSEDRRTVLGVIFAAGAIALLFWAKRTIVTDPRRRAVEAEGRRLGLAFSAADRTGIAALPYDLLAHPATLREVDNVLRGTWEGTEVLVFEFRRANGETEWRYTCVMRPVPTGWPWLLLKPRLRSRGWRETRGSATSSSSPSGSTGPFEVRSSDRRFATAVLEPRMMEWLMELSPRYGFEVRDGWLLAFTTQVQPWEIDLVLRTGAEFLDRVPSVAHSLFGADAPPRPDDPSRAH